MVDLMAKLIGKKQRIESSDIQSCNVKLQNLKVMADTKLNRFRIPWHLLTFKDEVTHLILLGWACRPVRRSTNPSIINKQFFGLLNHKKGYKKATLAPRYLKMYPKDSQAKYKKLIRYSK